MEQIASSVPEPATVGSTAAEEGATSSVGTLSARRSKPATGMELNGANWVGERSRICSWAAERGMAKAMGKRVRRKGSLRRVMSRVTLRAEFRLKKGDN